MWHKLQQVHRWPHPCRSSPLVDLLQKRGYWYPSLFFRFYRTNRLYAQQKILLPLQSDDVWHCLHHRTARTYAAQMAGYVRTPSHFRCITVRTDSMLIKFVRAWACLPTVLAFVTKKRVNYGQTYFRKHFTFPEFPNKQGVWYNVQIGGFVYGTFSPRHVKAE